MYKIPVIFIYNVILWRLCRAIFFVYLAYCSRGSMIPRVSFNPLQADDRIHAPQGLDTTNSMWRKTLTLECLGTWHERIGCNGYHEGSKTSHVHLVHPISSYFIPSHLHPSQQISPNFIPIFKVPFLPPFSSHHVPPLQKSKKKSWGTRPKHLSRGVHHVGWSTA